ncbi:MAG: PKD domain-containing protein [Anaerolineae bacterium]
MTQKYAQLAVALGVGLLLVTMVWASGTVVEATDYLEAIIDIYPGSASSYPKYLTAYDGAILFQADDGTSGAELWSYNGVSATLTVDIWEGSDAGGPRDLIVYSDALYFQADDGTHGKELWSYDGTTATLVQDLDPGTGDASPMNPAVYDGTLYFAANDGIHGSELWRYDGVTTTLVADLNPVFSNLGPSHLFVHEGTLYFRASDGVHGQELWSYDGVTTTLVSDLLPGSGSSDPGSFAVYKGMLYFGAQNPLYQYHLYRYDGSDVTQIGTETYLFPGPEYLTVHDGALYFANSESTYGRELWRYDGDLLERVTDIDPGSGSGYPAYLTSFAGKLYFYANDSIHGYELWSYHDDAAHLELDINLNPSSASSNPSEFTPLGDRLYFRANDGFKGDELTYIIPTPLLQVQKRASNSTPEAGDPLTYTVLIEHPGGLPLSEVTLSDTLPAGITFAGPVTLEPAHPEATVATSAGDLPIVASGLTLSTGDRVTVTLPVTVDPGLDLGTVITNTVEVTSAEAPSRTAVSRVTIAEAACLPITAVNLTASPAGELTAGATVRFLADTQGGTRPIDYAWYLDGTPVTAAGEVYEHTFAEAGTYTMGVTATNTCSADAPTTTVTILPAEPDRPDLSASQLWVSRSTAQSGDVLTYTTILRNASAVTATATVTNTRPDFRYALVVPGSAEASDGAQIAFDEDYWTWSGDVVSGTPVLLTYAVTVGSPPEGTVLQNSAHIDDGTGRTTLLTADTLIAPDFGLAINDGASYTNQPTVTLTYAWNPTTVITEAYLGSCSGSVCKSSGWLPLPTAAMTATYPDWTLDVSGDERLLYSAWVLYQNGLGETVGPFYDTILYDPGTPTITSIEVLTNTAVVQTMTEGAPVTVRVTTQDANSGVSVLHASDTADFATYASIPVTGSTTDFAWTLAEGEGIYVRAVDRAGNVSAADYQSYGADYAVYLPLVIR